MTEIGKNIQNISQIEISFLTFPLHSLHILFTIIPYHIGVFKEEYEIQEE